MHLARILAQDGHKQIEIAQRLVSAPVIKFRKTPVSKFRF
jgi:hypothetical protein